MRISTWVLIGGILVFMILMFGATQLKLWQLIEITALLVFLVVWIVYHETRE